MTQNDSVATLLARLEGILGPIPEWMVCKGRYSHRFYTKTGHLYERVSTPGRASGSGGSPSGAASGGVSAGGGGDLYELLVPKRTSMSHRIPDAAPGLLDLIGCLLSVDPRKRPSAAEALMHPWLQHVYPSLDSMV
jgi:serine/threonine protein kinase